MGGHHKFPIQGCDYSLRAFLSGRWDSTGATYNMLERATGHSWCPPQNIAVFIDKIPAEIAFIVQESLE